MGIESADRTAAREITTTRRKGVGYTVYLGCVAVLIDDNERFIEKTAAAMRRELARIVTERCR